MTGTASVRLRERETFCLQICVRPTAALLSVSSLSSSCGLIIDQLNEKCDEQKGGTDDVHVHTAVVPPASAVCPR